MTNDDLRAESGDATNPTGGDTPARDAASKKSALWALLVVAVALAISGGLVAIYGYTARAAGDRDPFIYAQIGKEMIAGKRLYSETWIDKPPLALLMYAAPQLVAPRSYEAISIFGGIVIVAQALLFGYALRSVPAAAIATALFMSLYPLDDGTFVWPSTEHFANLYVTGNLLLALAITRDGTFSVGQCLAAGALAIAAFHVRQNTVLSGLLPVLAVALCARPLRERLTGGVWMIVGGLAVWAAMIAVVLVVGDLGGYFWALFVYPRRFAALGSLAESIELMHHFASSLLVKLLLVFGILAFFRPYRSLVLGTIVIGIGGCMFAMHNHHHYLANTLPYIALLIGLGTQRLRQFGPGLPWMATAAVAIALLPAAQGRMNIVAEEPTHIELTQVADEIDRLAPPAGTLWVCGPLPSEAIQFASRLPAAHTHCWVFQMREPWLALLPKSWETILAEYLAQPPTVLVVQEQLVAQALADPPPDQLPEYLQLVRALLTKVEYEQASRINGYAIFICRTTPRA